MSSTRAACRPAVRLRLTLDNAAQNDCGVGTLNINTGGNLHLLNVAADGPSYVFMDTLNMGADGTITFDLPAPVGGGANEPIGTYPQVFVDTANLDGTIVANITAPANGLWDNTTYQNVIDAVTRNGTFDHVHDQRHPDGIAADQRRLHLRQCGERRHRR